MLCKKKYCLVYLTYNTTGFVVGGFYKTRKKLCMQDLSQMEWQREHRTPYQISLLRQPYVNKISFKF